MEVNEKGGRRMDESNVLSSAFEIVHSGGNKTMQRQNTIATFTNRIMLIILGCNLKRRVDKSTDLPEVKSKMEHKKFGAKVFPGCSPKIHTGDGIV